MTNKELTPERMFQEFNEIVAKRDPGFTYKNPNPQFPGECVYVHVNEDEELSSGCIVGEWLSTYGGVPLADILPSERTKASMVLTRFGFTGEGVDFAQFVQRSQDKGKPWEEAVELAADKFGLLAEVSN